MSDVMVDYGVFTGEGESQGEWGGDVLPPGKYPLKIASAQGNVTKNGVPLGRMRVVVTEGPYKDKGTFVDLYLGASGSSRTKDGQEYNRTSEQFKEAAQNAVNKANGFLKALRVHKVPTPNVERSRPEFTYEYFNVASWEGREFMGRVIVDKGSDTPRNSLMAFASMDDPKNGVATWREKELPKQVAAHAKATGGGV